MNLIHLWYLAFVASARIRLCTFGVVIGLKVCEMLPIE